MLAQVSLQDWISLAVGLLGLLVGYLAHLQRLPAPAREWLSKIGTDRILDAIQRADAIIDLSPDQRRQQAAAYLQKLCKAELGITVPTSIINLLVEFVYQQWKKRTGK